MKIPVGLLFVISVGFVQTCATAMAQTEPGRDAAAPVHGAPSWLERPSAYDVERVYPSRAATLGLSGLADMTCKVQPDGRLSDCVATADPQNAGFEEAAVKLAPMFRMGWTGGAPVIGGTVRIPIRFRISRH